jgi:hypothetical protein
MKGSHFGNRTFTTPADAYAVKEALIRKGKWQEFYFGYAWPIFINNQEEIPDSADLTAWLFSTDESGDQRIAVLAGEFLRRELWESK